jgi:hypothetical protein
VSLFVLSPEIEDRGEVEVDNLSIDKQSAPVKFLPFQQIKLFANFLVTPV